jgi:hypothetical protein
MTSSIFERGIYTGAELQHRSNRPGAYDAFAFPSLGACRTTTAGRVAAAAPARATPRGLAVTGSDAAPQLIEPRTLTQGRISLSAYRPHKGSAPALVIAALNVEGEHISYLQICERFGVNRHNVTAIFKSAIVKGALVRHRAPDGQVLLSLPGYVYVPPAPPEPEPAAPEPQPSVAKFSEVAAAHALLEQRKAELRLWRGRVAALEQHARFRSVIRDIHRFAYPTNYMPAA